MNNKTKKILGVAALIASIGVLSSCKSFCEERDISSYYYGYDPISISLFDSRSEALEYINLNIPEDCNKVSLNTKLFNGKDTYSLISETKLEGYNFYYINAGTVETTNTEGETVSIVFGKNEFITSLETSAKANKINLPNDQFYTEFDRLTLDSIYDYTKSKDSSLKDKMELTYEDLYGYSFEDYVTYKTNPTDELLNKMLKGSETNIGRNSTMLARYGYVKYFDFNENDKTFKNIEKYNQTILEMYGTNFAMNSDFLNLYEKNLENKVVNLNTCISFTDDEMYGHISNNPLNETVPITNKSGTNFFNGWGKTFKEKGFLEGLLVYPIAYGVEGLSHKFGMNGWGQIWAVLLVTIIVRFIFMGISMPSTISQQRMTFLQPEIAKLQQKYPNSQTNEYERQRLAQAQMALYKKNNVHPFMSLLIIIVQFPLFISVWNAMRGCASLSSDSVMGLYLSDTIWSVLKNVSGWPNNPGWWTALVLILLMSGSQILAMLIPNWINKKKLKKVAKTTVSQGQNDQEKQTKIMQYVMTGLVIFMGFSLPSAMGVYWFAGAIFSIIQTLVTQAIMNRKKKGDR